MERLVRLFKALSDVTRLEIIRLLIAEEMCVCEIMDRLGMSQPAVSHHLRILKEAGIVGYRRSGKWLFYSLRKDQFTQYEGMFEQHLAAPIRNSQPASKPDPESSCAALTARETMNRERAV